MTWHALRLPDSRRRELVYLRIGALLAAWVFVAVNWLDWRALPFQALLGAVVAWHAVRRETKWAQIDAVAEQLRFAEERYRTLVETLPLATYVDRPGRATGAAWVSPQITSITSYSPEEWVADPDLLTKVLHPDDRERTLSEIARAKAAGADVDVEYRLVRRDGSVVWIHDSATTGHDAPRGFVVDVTQRRHAELELERQNERLRELDTMKDEFVALVSHELRTPLTSIRGYVELMREDTTVTGEQAGFLQTIDRNAARLQRVVADLLFVAQVDAGKLTLERASIDLNAVVHDAIEAGKPAAAQKSISLRTTLEELPSLEGDQARLAQVLDNLVSNAIKFTPSGGTVTVTTTNGVHAVELAVADTGMGIPADELPRLFERFFRTERAAATAIPGTGLGLAIAKAIVEGHGGAIAVESEEGAGTTFRIVLPR
ncbi:MAG TPA: ATP-binding protein [Gaiellaceae bacterium]